MTLKTNDTGRTYQRERGDGEVPKTSYPLVAVLIAVLVIAAFSLGGMGVFSAGFGAAGSGAPGSGVVEPGATQPPAADPGDGEAPAVDPSATGPGKVQESPVPERPRVAGEEDDPDWTVLVEIDRQRVYIWEDRELVRTMVCSTGTRDKPTPTGEFRIENRGEWFYSRKYQQGGKWWVSFLNRGEYLFHSLPMDAQGNLLEEEAEKLGQPASHGCVRLSVDDAHWFYDHIPADTPVVIR